MTLVQVGVLATSIVVPLALFLTKRHQWLVIWLMVTMCIEIFNSLSIVSITATKAAGLVLLPYVVTNLSPILKTKPGQCLAAISALLVVLGILYGHVWPWPDYSGERTLRQLAQGRSALYTGSYLLELSAALYLALQLRNRSMLRYLVYGTVAGCALSGVGAILERYASFDFFYYFSGWDPRVLSLRQRGFNYEPRGLGYTTAVGLLVLLIPTVRLRFAVRAALMCLVFWGFHLSASVSGLALLIAGIVWLFGFNFINRKKAPEDWNSLKKSFALLGAYAVIFLTLPIFQPTATDRDSVWLDNFTAKRHVFVPKDQSPSLEPYDQAALVFFAENPKHVLLGTGPGLISLAASERGRIDSLPHVGILREISNYGIVGFLGWAAMMWLLFVNMSSVEFLADPENRTRYSLFLLIVGLFLLQAKVFWLVALAIGFAEYLRGGEDDGTTSVSRYWASSEAGRGSH